MTMAAELPGPQGAAPAAVTLGYNLASTWEQVRVRHLIRCPLGLGSAAVPTVEMLQGRFWVVSPALPAITAAVSDGSPHVVPRAARSFSGLAWALKSVTVPFHHALACLQNAPLTDEQAAVVAALAKVVSHRPLPPHLRVRQPGHPSFDSELPVLLLAQ